MVSEPLLWPFLSSVVFIRVTPFSTSLPPSQQPLQPFVDEPPTSSSRHPWVPNLQPPSLRNFTLHIPLPFASPLQILLWLRFWRYHKDRLASIYTLVKASTPSETTRAPTRRSKALFRWSRTTRTFHAPLHIWVFSHVPSRTVASSHAPFTLHHTLSRASTLSLMSLLTSSTSALACTIANVTYLNQPLMSSFDPGGLTVDIFSRVDFFNPDSSYPVFRVDFIFTVSFCLFCL